MRLRSFGGLRLISALCSGCCVFNIFSIDNVIKIIIIVLVGDPATRVITVSHFDIFPKPIAIPGNITTDYDITIHRRIPTNTHYRLNVTMEKKLLGNWHSVPCSRGVGTW